MLKPFCESQQSVDLQEMEIPHYVLPEKPACGSRSNSQNHTWKNGLVQNWKRKKAAYCHPAYLTYMQYMSYKMPDWNQDWQEKYQ